MQSLHRVRERWVTRPTAVTNQIRGLLLERGITVPKDGSIWKPQVALTDAEGKLSATVRLLLAQLKLELDQLALRLEEADALIQQITQENESCRRLNAIPGIGPITATALTAAIGNGAAFRKGREFAAWVGLVPREHTSVASKSCSASANVETLTCGNCLCKAPCCSAIQREAVTRSESMAGKMSSHTHYNVVGVALANKLARMAWAVLSSGEAYRPPVAV